MIAGRPALRFERLAAVDPIPVGIEQLGRFEVTVEREGPVVVVSLRPSVPRPTLARLRMRLSPTAARDFATALGLAKGRGRV